MKIIASESGIRIDKYLALNTDFSRELITKMITSGFVSVNDNNVKNSYKVKIDDEIFIDETFKIDTSILPEDIPLDIVFENDNVIVINKPSGMVVHPGSGNYSGTLVNALMHHTKNLSDKGGSSRCGIVHRIDKDTSGLMLAVKNNEAHSILSEDFKDHLVKREYLALLCGSLPYESATIDAPIKRDSENFNKMCVAKGGKEAITHLKVEKRFKDYTLVRLNLETGRTHQIRVHMNYIGYPIFNDPVYNNKNASEFGQFLHSTSIRFTEPITKEEVFFEVPLPKEFQEFIDTLK